MGAYLDVFFEINYSYSLDKCGIKKKVLEIREIQYHALEKEAMGPRLDFVNSEKLHFTEVSRIKRSVTNLQRSISSFPKPKYILQNCSIFQKLLKNIASKQGPTNYVHHCIAEFASLMIPFILQNLK